MNRYEEKQERRRQRLEARAARKQAESDQAYKRGNDLVSGIPFGQPILVGHHSEKRHRRTLEKSRNLAFKSLDLQKEAEKIQHRAEAVGTGGVSSDDPEAVQKLTARLKELEDCHQTMKAANAFYKKNGTLVGFDGPPGLKEATERNFKFSNSKLPFPSYSLTNSSANIRRIKERIEQLKKPAPAFTSIDTPVYSVEMDEAENRFILKLKERVSKEKFREIRQAGWLWSPSRSAFVRKISPAAVWAAQNVGRLFN